LKDVALEQGTVVWYHASPNGRQSLVQHLTEKAEGRPLRPEIMAFLVVTKGASTGLVDPVSAFQHAPVFSLGEPLKRMTTRQLRELELLLQNVLGSIKVGGSGVDVVEAVRSHRDWSDPRHREWLRLLNVYPDDPTWLYVLWVASVNGRSDAARTILSLPEMLSARRAIEAAADMNAANAAKYCNREQAGPIPRELRLEWSRRQHAGAEPMEDEKRQELGTWLDQHRSHATTVGLGGEWDSVSNREDVRRALSGSRGTE
jgi:hypothetical protein